jgi:hypothetical protein
MRSENGQEEAQETFDKDGREKKNRGTVQEHKQRETLERMKTNDEDRDR